jgi:NAD(P)-dependent dehydrogenase (short-subunit alcohol dehydrogenase family)
MTSGIFEDQGFLVIGGTEDIGQAVVLLAAQRGASVVFTAPPAAEDQATEILAAAARVGAADRVRFVPADLFLPEETDRLFDLAVEQLPGLHVLVVNLAQHASLYQGQPLVGTSLAQWNHGLSLYLRQPFLITQRALDEFLFGGEGGRIVFITSMPASANSHVSVEAGASALSSFVRSVTKEYGRRNIAANALVIHAESKDSAAELPEPAAGLPESVAELPDSPPGPGAHAAPGPVDTAAETLLFLASAEASFVNGEVLTVDASSRFPV